MTITLIGTGGVFTRTGVFGRCANNLNGILGTVTPSPGSAWGSGGPTINDLADQINLIEAQFQSTNQQLITSAGGGDIYAARDAARTGLDGLKTTLAVDNQLTISTMANDDVGLLNGPTDLTGGLQELIRQMNNSADTILGPTITVTPAAGIPVATGTPTVAASLKDPKGLSLDYVYNEVLDVICTVDSFGATPTNAGRETLSISGDIPASGGNSGLGMLSWDWPKGSGANTSISAGDAAENAGTNVLTNGSFDAFSVADTPDSWTIVAGSPGTTIKQENSDTVGSSAHALKLVGDGATLHQLKQAVTGLVTASTVYALNVFGHVGATAPVAGKVRFALVDGSGTVINDDNGVGNAYTVDFTQSTLQTTYKASGAMTTTELNAAALAGGAGQIFFRTPTNMPTALFIEIKATTAISTTNGSVFIDHMCLRAAVQAYGAGVGGGPYVAVFSGATKLVLNDRFKITVSNGYQGAFSKWAWRAFDLPAKSIRIPSLTSANTISDTLIT